MHTSKCQGLQRWRTTGSTRLESFHKVFLTGLEKGWALTRAVAEDLLEE